MQGVDRAHERQPAEVRGRLLQHALRSAAAVQEARRPAV
eukprot:CAMPEP_0168457362 /NCGR_PEP_ID=MMETSP0228-20121227/51793_1 /TAXON_ID=133427 /ORGANISM="Protoceratium reticulatum, Strain CCCM 535 (=CCMP 1889)" /LENGTH=38 /DNA_ID= /DNA_START= /DNA_END= /DNA_ORIENTATION=